MSTALFLGAGASTPYGMPTTKELQEKIYRDPSAFPLKGLLDPSKFPDIEYTLAALGDTATYAKSLGGRFYAALPEQNFSDFVTKSVDSKEVIEEHINLNYALDKTYHDAVKSVLEPLLGLAKSDEGDATVFTTNFDPVVEEYCRNITQGTRCIDGFSFDRARDEIVWENDFSAGDDDSGDIVYLYKLHGSMNWLEKHSVDGRPYVARRPDAGMSDDPVRDMYIRPSLDVKYEATRRKPYSDILRRFNKELPSFDACAVVGYSFRDRHISSKMRKFAEKGGMLIVLSPTAASDFCENALGFTPNPAEKADWAKRSLCRLTYSTPSGNGAIYTIHQKIGKETIDAAVDAINSTIDRRSTCYPIGPIKLGGSN